MANVDSLWFSTPNPETLCRGGGNGPQHPSQLYAIKKYVNDSSWTILDYGCGGGTTLEAILKWVESDEFTGIDRSENVKRYYKGVDIIPKNIEWCKKQWPQFEFEVNEPLHKIDQPDDSFDVVYSRHVVDHMDSFENGLDEHCRVAKKLVIIVLWRPLGTGDEHQIKNIVENGKVYENEYTNDYSKSKVLEALEEKEKEGWRVLELAEGVGKEVSGFDTVIVLKRDEE